LKESITKGLSFGLTSGIITTLGLMVGLNSGTGSKMVVLGGIVTISVADAASDALGIHISEEAENKHTHKEIWEATIATFIGKFIFSLSFIIPIIFLELQAAVITGVVWGGVLLTVLSYFLAKKQKINPISVISEHLAIATGVIIITYYLGKLISHFFGGGL
jgi:vacuolar iron transporter family protein